MILLTAAGTLGDRLAGLTDGADDYVVKPFEPRELLARIRAVLRRLEAPGERRRSRRRRGRRSASGRCTFDTEARCLRDPEGGEIALTAMEYDLLEVFSRHPRQVLCRARGSPSSPTAGRWRRATARSTSASPGCAPRSARTPAPRGRSGRCTARATSSTPTRDPHACARRS